MTQDTVHVILPQFLTPVFVCLYFHCLNKLLIKTSLLRCTHFSHHFIVLVELLKNRMENFSFKNECDESSMTYPYSSNESLESATEFPLFEAKLDENDNNFIDTEVVIIGKPSWKSYSVCLFWQTTITIKTCFVARPCSR